MGQSENEIVKNFGEPIEIVKFGDGGREFKRILYHDIEFLLIDCRIKEPCLITQFSIKSGKYTLPNGLKIGISRKDVFELLRTEFEIDLDNNLTFWTGQMHGYKIEFENSIISKITIIDGI